MATQGRFQCQLWTWTPTGSQPQVPLQRRKLMQIEVNRLVMLCACAGKEPVALSWQLRRLFSGPVAGATEE